MSQPKRFTARILSALLGALLFRLPYWILQFYESHTQGLLPWSGDRHTWCIWDCSIYTQLSQSYTPETSAFFPLFPFIVRVGTRLLPDLGPNGVTLLLSNLLTLVAGILFLYYADSIWPDSDKDKKKIGGFAAKSWLALLFLSIFPEGHFWLRGYSEPLFFSLLIAILYSFRRERWLLGGIFCGLIAITRPPGLWVDGICVGFLVWRLFVSLRSGRRCGEFLAALVFCGVPFLGFMAWLWAKTGNPLYFYAAQSHGWGRHFDLIGGLKDHLPRWDAGHLYLYLGLFASLRFLRRPFPEWLLLGAITLALTDLPIYFGGFYSYVRFASASPGLFLATSELAEESNLGTILVIAWCLVRLALQMQQSMTGWVG